MNVLDIIASGSFKCVKYDACRDINVLSREEKQALPKDHTYLDYSGITDDYSWSRAMAYIRVDDEELEVPDGWYIVWNDHTKFMLDPKSFEALFGKHE